MRSFISWPRLFLIFLILLALLWLISCNTASHNAKNVNKAILYYPAQTAKQFSDKWPCIPIATVSDSTALKAYLEELAALKLAQPPELVPDTIMEIWADTAKIKALRKQVSDLQQHEKYLNGYISNLTELCQGKPAIHDTIKISSDTADVQVYTSQIEQLGNERDRYVNKYEKRSSFAFWLIIALAVSTIANILLIKFKKYAAHT